MSDSAPRRDSRRFIPCHPLTGDELTLAQENRVATLRDAAMVLRAAMHEAIGENFDPEARNADLFDKFGSRDMAIAATHLDTCLLWAYRAAMEAP
jgi:hypothetical protein